MADLWREQKAEARRAAEPLAVRVRPRTIDEVVGHTAHLGPGALLRRMIEADALTSIILHGPPGVGKTTLAEAIAASTKRHFVQENAAGVGVARIREILDAALRRLESLERGDDRDGRTILFLDEIHRFTKAQQDILLRDVERGVITLIGATTENPLFTVNSALVSRSTLFRLEPLSEDEVVEVLRRALADADRGYGRVAIEVHDDALALWARLSEGDARRALTALEVAVGSSRRADGPIVIDEATARASMQAKAINYDRAGDQHYDHASALIKSVRGCDPDAALHWVARMLEGGEDPRFIARRMAILASEDIGNADPRATMLAQACWDLVERIGMPECRITLGQLVAYLALAPKSNASYAGIDAAMRDVREGSAVVTPVELRGTVRAPTADGRKAGEGYVYNHAQEANSTIGAITGQDYLGVDRTYYEPSPRGFEATLAERLEQIRSIKKAKRAEDEA